MVRDKGSADRWKLGDVKQVYPGGKCTVMPVGWKDAFMFREVREAKIDKGCRCRVKHDAVVFESVDSWEWKRDLFTGEEVIAGGEPEHEGEYIMVPLEEGGAVELSALELTALAKNVEAYDEDDEGSCSPLMTLYRVSPLLFLLWVTVGLVTFTTQTWAPENRSHSIAEAFYVMAQIITTDGDGDLMPRQRSGWLFLSLYMLVAAALMVALVGAVANAMVDRQIKAMGKVAKAVVDGAAVPIPRGCCNEDLISFLQALAIWGVFLALGTLLFSKGCVPELPVLSLPDVEWMNLQGISGLGGAVSDWQAGNVTNASNASSPAPAATSLRHQPAHQHPPADSAACEKEANRTLAEAFYLSVTTLTGVGSDEKAPSTSSGACLRIVWMVLGVAAFTNVLAKFSSLSVASRHGLTDLSERWLERMFEDPVIQQCMKEADRSVPAVGRAEFILYMLQQTGAADPKLVDALNQNFSDLDLDRSGQLDENDLQRRRPDAVGAQDYPGMSTSMRSSRYAPLAEQS